MAYYIIYNNKEIYTAERSEALHNLYPDYDIQELPQDYNSDKYHVVDGELVINPNYEKEQAEKEQERINNLTMTALDFIGVLEQFGLDYVTEIKPFLEAHQDLDKQLKYCQNVWCGVAKQIFAEPIEIGGITINSEMIEQAFKNKNGEN